jgi:hypothetical protein
MKMNVMAGPGIILPIGRISLYFGIGCTVLGTTVSHEEESEYLGAVKYERFVVNTGVGCRLGMEWSMTKNLFLSLDCILMYDFSNYTSFTSKFGDFSGFTDNYAMFEIRPHVSIGVYLTEFKKSKTSGDKK